MTVLPVTCRAVLRRRILCGAMSIVALATMTLATFVDIRPAAAQRGMIEFPKRPSTKSGSGPSLTSPKDLKNSKEQMLVRANEVNYDYTNERVSAIGNVQAYYAGSTLEADRLIYDPA